MLSRMTAGPSPSSVLARLRKPSAARSSAIPLSASEPACGKLFRHPPPGSAQGSRTAWTCPPSGGGWLSLLDGYQKDALAYPPRRPESPHFAQSARAQQLAEISLRDWKPGWRLVA